MSRASLMRLRGGRRTIVVGQARWLPGLLLGNPVVAAVAMRLSGRVMKLGSAARIVRFGAQRLKRYEGEKGALGDENGTCWLGSKGGGMRSR